MAIPTFLGWRKMMVQVEIDFQDGCHQKPLLLLLYKLLFENWNTILRDKNLTFEAKEIDACIDIKLKLC